MGIKDDDISISGGGAAVVGKLSDLVEELTGMPDYRNVFRKQFYNLARRIKLLGPMFEELRESREPINGVGLEPLAGALADAVELLRFGCKGSKISLVVDQDRILKRFQEISAQLEQALDQISLDKLDISDEVREQVELVHAQLRRAKDKVDVPDVELQNDISSVYDGKEDDSMESKALKRISEKLHLTTICDLKQESLALNEIVFSSCAEVQGQNGEKMLMLLKKIEDFIQSQNPGLGMPANQSTLITEKPNIPVVPDDFRCPISLDLMKDPVIVATGQTYERVCIQKWLDAGHKTCPKTQQKLCSTSLTPNYVLRSLIAHWCEASGLDPPKCPRGASNPFSGCSSDEHAKIEGLLRKLSSANIEDQCSAACELRLLAKRNADNRVCIAEAGAIPLLVGLLSTIDAKTQEHAVTALLNLSICEENKGTIVSSGAVPGIVHVLRSGCMEARENAAATLFSLSVVDEYKVTIGASGAIPALVILLSEGSQRGRKDAATALFNLCIYQGNKGRAVRAGLVPILMGLLTDPAGTMVDEALAILAILSSHPEGKSAIGEAEAVPALVEVIGSGTPRNRENAAAIMVHLCGGEQQVHHLAEAQERGVMGPLLELAVNGTDRGKRKAAQLLERMQRFIEQQKQAQVQAESFAQTQTEQLRFSPPPPDCGS